jgi:magnesium-transporting ATPase (P-type)
MSSTANLYSYSKHPYLLSVQETAQAAGTDIDKGLSSAQVAEASKKYPKNEFDVGGSVPWYTILSKQFFNAMVLVRSLLFTPYFYRTD